METLPKSIPTACLVSLPFEDLGKLPVAFVDFAEAIFVNCQVLIVL